MKILVRHSPLHGLGVFAACDMAEGEEAIINYVLPLADTEGALAQTTIANYYFDWYGEFVLIMGEASFINHSNNPNLDWSYEAPERRVTFTATRAISKGDELTFDYGWDKYPWDSKNT